MPLTLDFVRAYLKADSADDTVITALMASARSICQDYCNRNFFDTDELLATAVASATTTLATTLAARDAELAAGASPPDVGTKYATTLGAIRADLYGVVINDSISAAILLTIGHLYTNREDVDMPTGAQRILQRYLWIGELV